MNKFLNKKKAAPPAIVTDNTTFDAILNQPDTSPGLSQKSPGLQKKRTMRWGKKKPIPEPKPEFNIALALPASDDFRTSLIMPNLSKRFSMLREQDDPLSKLGKAMDDSVLQPRRRSRMMDFGYSSPLGDISEVASINSSIRPPFLGNRHGSYGSEEGYGSENDAANSASVMSRARPGEGNVMFGGRQKVYMIPKTGVGSTRSLGKAVYEDDIGTSAFQKYRQTQREHENRPSEESNEISNDIHGGFDFGISRIGASVDDGRTKTPNDSAKDLSDSPSLSSYERERKRSTASTSHSEARSSTAATSIASQPAAPVPLVASTVEPVPARPDLTRSNTKTRRLYEQGLDQHMHEQQSSALTRLNSLHRQRGPPNARPGAPKLHTARSAGNLHDKPPQPVYTVQTQSPSMSNFAGVRRQNSNHASPSLSGPGSPTSPSLNACDLDDAWNQAMDPADRGKATAMGVFNKPAAQFDEHQYMERQKVLQRSNSSAKIAAAAKQTAIQQRIGRFEGKGNHLIQHRSDSLRKGSAPPRARSRSKSNPRTNDKPSAYNVFQKAANAITAQPAPLPVRQDSTTTVDTRADMPERRPLPDTHRTFFGDIGGSDSEEDDDTRPQESAFTGPDYGYGTQHGRWQPTVLPAVSEHPALRSEKSKSQIMEEDELQPRPLRTTQSKASLKSLAKSQNKPSPKVAQDHDSPTLAIAEPLTGMIQHLRIKSTASSLYPDDERDAVTVDPSHPDVPNMPYMGQTYENGGRTARSTFGAESRVESTYSSSNPWDLEESDRGYYGSGRYSEISPVDVTNNNSRFGSRAPSLATTSRERKSEVSQFSDDAHSSSWQHEMRRQAHQREASNATQQERDAFANELAQRQKAIQEKLAGVVDTNSRAASPVPPSNSGFKAFGMLRSKSSRDSVGRTEVSAKAMKILGASAPSSTRDLHSQYERSAASFDQSGRPRAGSGSRPPLPRTQVGEHEAWRERELYRARGESEVSKGDWPTASPNTVTPPPSHAARERARSRSNSAATYSRSRSRGGQYRDDLEKAMREGTGSSAYGHPELVPQELTPRPSPDITQEQYRRDRSNSRPAPREPREPRDYFDAKNLQPLTTAQNGHLTPAGPASAGPSPSSSSIAPSPIASGYAHTPPISGSNTPVNGSRGFTPPSAVSTPGSATTNYTLPKSNGVKARKKTISKSDISEPTLISSTSNIDTVDLPEGASLKNGMEDAPPIPPINPRRRGTKKLFGGAGREQRQPSDPPLPQHQDLSHSASNGGRVKTPDPWAPQRSFPLGNQPFDHAAGGNRHYNGLVPSASNGGVGRPRMHSASQQNSYEDRPNEKYNFGPNTSPERIGRSPPRAVKAAAVEGGMF